MSFTPVMPLEASGAIPHANVGLNGFGDPASARSSTSFSDMLVDGIDGANAKIAEADRLTQAFVLDDNIPVHQVTFALEQARLSMELMLQVRGKLLEGYQQLMNMQL